MAHNKRVISIQSERVPLVRFQLAQLMNGNLVLYKYYRPDKSHDNSLRHNELSSLYMYELIAGISTKQTITDKSLVSVTVNHAVGSH